MTTPSLILGSAGASGEQAQILLALAFVLAGAKLAGALVARLGQPAVLGELLVGVILGNLALFGGPSLEALEASETFAVIAELGAILLLFDVGLESTPKEMLAVGLPATAVAVLGVVTPMALGYGVGWAVLPEASWMTHAFLGAMLAATSVGITARVLQDANAIRKPAARIILGAAVIDDVLGLVVLAIISGVIQAAASGVPLDGAGIALIVFKAFAFLVLAVAIGSAVSPRLFRQALAIQSTGLVQALSLSVCFGLAWLAQKAGLAPIVGAFAAGLILEDVHFEDHIKRGDRPLHESLRPLTALLVPVFFVRMGMLVELENFLEPGVLGFAVLLTAAAAIGKWACAFGTPRGVSGMTVGLGMMPRGEVGLIFAGIGAQLTLGGEPVVSGESYAAAVFMVVVTTMATPPALLWALRRDARRAAQTAPAPP
ncbi:MAG: cation:proton antiporter [Acidobacteriota bacterium]|jgi:Kef-type K+ transport system membrane component KefB